MFKIGDLEVLPSGVATNLERYYAANKDDFLKNHKQVDAKSLDTALGAFVDAIRNGHISSRNSDRSYTDSTGALKEDNEYNRYIALMLNNVVDQIQKLPPKKSEENVKKEEEKVALKPFETYFIEQAFGGSDSPSWEPWLNLEGEPDATTGMRGNKVRTEKALQYLQNYLAETQKDGLDYSNTPFSSKEDAAAKINAAIAALEGGVQNNEYMAFTPLGLSNTFLNGMFGEGLTKEELEAQKKAKEEETKKAEEEQKKKEQDAKVQAYLTNTFGNLTTRTPLGTTYQYGIASTGEPNEDFTNYLIDTLGRGNVENFYTSWLNRIGDPNMNYGEAYAVPEDAKDYYKRIFGKKHTVTNGDVMGLVLNNIIGMGDKNGLLIANNDGTYAIVPSFQANNGTIINYDPATGKYIREYAYGDNADRRGYYTWDLNRYLKSIQQPLTTYEYKEGGEISKLQSGGYVDNDLYEYYLGNKRRLNEKYQQAADAHHRTLEQEKLGQTQKIKDTDHSTAIYMARIGALAADAAGLVTSYMPGAGTVLAASTGLGAVGGNLIADLLDPSISDKHAFQNAGVNLGMEVLSLVPGAGIVAKGNKLIKGFANVAPWIVTSVAVPTIKKSVNELTSKIDKGEKFTLDDWRAMAEVLTSVASMSKAGTAAIRRRRITSRANLGPETGPNVTVAHTNGSTTSETLTKEQMDFVNEKFKSKTFAEDFKAKFNTTWAPVITKTLGFKNNPRLKMKGGDKDFSIYSSENYNIYSRNEARKKAYERFTGHELGKPGSATQNPVTQNPVTSTPELSESILPEWDMHKNGGVLKAQSGTTLDFEKIRAFKPAYSEQLKGRALQMPTYNQFSTDQSGLLQIGSSATQDSTTIHEEQAPQTRWEQFSQDFQKFYKPAIDTIRNAEPESLAYFRYLSNVANNKRMLENAKKAMVPAFLTPIEHHDQVRGNLLAQYIADQQVANANQQAAHMNTSDARLRANGYGQTQVINANTTLQGALANQQEVQRTSEIERQNAIANEQSANAALNQNNAAQKQMDLSIKQYENATDSANQTSKNSLLMQIEEEAKNRRNARNQYQYGIELDDWVRNTEEGKEFKRLSNKTNKTEEEKQRFETLSNIYYDMRNKLQAKYIYNSRFGLSKSDSTPFQLDVNSLFPIPSEKRGGEVMYKAAKVKAESDRMKEFNKTQKHLIDTNVKLINGCSQTTQRLILKALRAI